MKKLPVTLAAFTSLLLLVGSSAQAQSIPWVYSAPPSEIYNNNSGSKSSSIKFDGQTGVANNNSGPIIYTLTSTSSASGGADFFDDVKFDLAITLTDGKSTSSNPAISKSSGVVDFSGLFSATNVTPDSLFPAKEKWLTPLVDTVTLGSDEIGVGWRTYTVTIFSFTSPGEPNGATGSIQATVVITPADGPEGNTGGGPNETPEPASLVLAGFGLPLFVLLRRRMKKGTPETVNV